jgi:hypothetical protein
VLWTTAMCPRAEHIFPNALLSSHWHFMCTCLCCFLRSGIGCNSKVACLPTFVQIWLLRSPRCSQGLMLPEHALNT